MELHVRYSAKESVRAETERSNILHSWIQSLTVFERTRAGGSVALLLPFAVLFLKAISNFFLGFGPGDTGRIHPTLKVGRRMRFDNVGWIRPHIQRHDQADPDGLHAVTKAPARLDVSRNRWYWLWRNGKAAQWIILVHIPKEQVVVVISVIRIVENVQIATALMISMKHQCVVIFGDP